MRVPHATRRALVLLAAVVGLGGAACTDIATPDRPDTPPYPPDRLNTGLWFRWPLERLPVRYFVSGPSGPVARYAADGITLWERELLYGEFRGIVVDDSATADVLVSVDGGPPPDVPLTDAPAKFVCSGATGFGPLTADGRIPGPLLVEIEWDSVATATDIANCVARVTAHEIGHTLGLFGHSPGDSDLMNANPRVRAPSVADRYTVQILYHSTPDIRPPERPTP